MNRDSIRSTFPKLDMEKFHMGLPRFHHFLGNPEFILQIFHIVKYFIWPSNRLYPLYNFCSLAPSPHHRFESILPNLPTQPNEEQKNPPSSIHYYKLSIQSLPPSRKKLSLRRFHMSDFSSFRHCHKIRNSRTIQTIRTKKSDRGLDHTQILR